MSFENAHQAISQAVAVIFNRWTALVLTIEHQLGGDPQHMRRLLEATVQLVTSSAPRYGVDELADHFESEFDRLQTDIEDGSPEQVAALIVQVRDAALRGDFSLAATIVEKARAATDHNNAAVTSVPGQAANHDDDDYEDDDGEDEGMDVGPVRQEPIVDYDGFTSVNHGGRHR